MKEHLEREPARQGFEENDGSRASDRGRPRNSAIAPVHYLRGATTLRPYRAQCAQCLRLYDRGRAEGLYGRMGGADNDL